MNLAKSGLKKFLIFFLLFFLLFGCLDVQKLPIEQRMACVDLASKSYAFVPQCDSESDCFSKIESSFFSFPQESFSDRMRQELYYYKNDLALSWFNYNNALENISKIRNICESEQNLQDLPQQLNELNRNLSNAFVKADDAGKRSVSILLIEENSMNESDLNLIKEEVLFDDFVSIRQNLSEFSSKKFGSNSYASTLYNETKKFNDLSQSYGFKPVVLNEFSELDLLEEYDSVFLKQLPDYKTNFFIPLFSGAISSIISYLNNAFRIGNGIFAMQSFPSFEFLKSFNDLVGTRNSVAKNFSELLRSDSLHRKKLTESRQLLVDSIGSKLPETADKIVFLNDFFSSTDENFLSDLIVSLQGNSNVLPQRFSMQNLSDFRKNSASKLFELQSSFYDLRQKIFLGKISLGKSVSESKNLTNELAGLNRNIDFLLTDSLAGVNALCNARVSEIESKIKIATFSSNSFSLVDLKNRAIFRINQFNEALPQKKLFYCKQSIDSFEEFSKALSDFESFEKTSELTVSSCFSDLDKILSSNVLLSMGEIDWVFLNQRFDLLKQKKQSFSEISSIKADCLKLKSEIEALVRIDSKIKSFERSFSNSELLLDKLNQISQHYPFALKQSVASQLTDSFSGFSKYFSGKKFKLFYADLLPELSNSVSEFESELRQRLKQAAIDFMKETVEIDFFSNSIPEAGKSFDSKTRIVFSNPFETINEPVFFELPFNGSFFEKTFSTPNVLSVKKNANFLSIDLNRVPLGETVLEFSSKNIVEMIEFTKPVSISQSNALFQKTIKFKTDGEIPKLKVFVKLIDSNSLQTENVYAIFDEKSTAFNKTANEIELFLENADSSKELIVFFSVKNPLFIGFSKVSGKTLSDGFSEEAVFSIEVKNNLSIALENANIVVPLGISNSDIENHSLRDESFFSINHSFSEKNLRFFEKFLPPFGEKTYFLSLDLKNSGQLRQNLLDSMKNQLYFLKNSPDSKIKTEAEQLILETESKNSLNELIQLNLKVQALMAKDKAFSENFSNYFSLKREIVSDLNSLNDFLNDFNGLNFKPDGAEKTSSKVKEKLQSAEALFSAKKFDDAMAKLFEAKAMLSESDFSSLNVFEKISERKKELFFNATKFLEELEKAGYSNASSEKQQFFQIDSELEKALSSKNLTKSKGLWEKFVGNVDLLQKSHSIALLNEAKKRFSIISNFEDLVSTSKKSLFDLQNLLDGVPENELIDSKFLPPISKNQLAKFELKLNSLVSPALLEKIDLFKETIAKKDYLNAIELFDSIQKLINEKTVEANDIGGQIDSAMNSIKEDALVSYNSAASLLNSSKFNKEAFDFLSKAQIALKEKSFLESIVSSNNATALLYAGKQKESFELPSAFFPIIACVGLLLLVKYKKKKDFEAKQLRLKKILRNWQ